MSEEEKVTLPPMTTANSADYAREMLAKVDEIMKDGSVDALFAAVATLRDALETISELPVNNELRIVGDKASKHLVELVKYTRTWIGQAEKYTGQSMLIAGMLAGTSLEQDEEQT